MELVNIMNDKLFEHLFNVSNNFSMYVFKFVPKSPDINHDNRV